MKSFAFCLALVFWSAAATAQFSSGGFESGGHGSGGDEKAEYSIVVLAGWNMMSVPVAVSDYAVSSLFPMATPPAYAYQGGYVTKDTLDNGPGYWLKFSSGQLVPMVGPAINADSVPVQAGWNIVGSLSSPFSVSSVTPQGTTVLSPFFGFNGASGYSPASTIEPGKGYFVKVSGAGSLLVASSGGPLPPGRPADDYLTRLNVLTIRDAAGSVRALYFAAGADDAPYDLPPVPPAGIFDARFSTQKMVTAGDADIQLSSVAYPIEIAWQVAEPGRFVLVAGGEEIAMTAAGSVRIVAPAAHLALRIGPPADLPTEFSLAQNFPNPFNPTTTITYDVPAYVGTGHALSLQVYDVLGRRVATLVNEVKEPGRYAVQWDAGGVASGVYYYRLDAGAYQAIRKMMLLK